MQENTRKKPSPQQRRQQLSAQKSDGVTQPLALSRPKDTQRHRFGSKAVIDQGIHLVENLVIQPDVYSDRAGLIMA